MLKKLMALTAIVMSVFVLALPARAFDTALIGNLTDNLGISQEQAIGGSGALMQYAQNRLGNSDWSSLTAALPAAAGLAGKAPDTSGSLMGKAASLGSGLFGGDKKETGTGNSYASLVGVAAAFSQLNLDEDLIPQFMPIIIQYALTEGGPIAADYLTRAFSN